MYKFFYSPIVRIDVSADFSYAAIPTPNVETYKKAFKINHDVSVFNQLLKEIKKVEEEFNMKTAIFMEATGMYHLSLFHFLNKTLDNVFVINPLVTKCNKNVDIKKVKNDKKDALSIAKIGKFQNVKLCQSVSLDIFLLRSLVREYYKLTDTSSTFKKKLSADLRVIFPGYSTVFSNITSLSSIALLSQYPSPKAVLDAPNNEIIDILINKSKKGLLWADKIYCKLHSIASNAAIINLPLPDLSIKITSNLALLNALELEVQNLLSEINTLINSKYFPRQVSTNIELLKSISGIGELTYIIIVSEISDINSFVKPKHLVAFFGIDSSVN